MADPLSIAGSAVGIVSIGLQVTSDFLRYLSSFKNQAKELSAVNNKLSGLQSSLRVLESTLKSIPDVSSARAQTIQLVNESIAACTEGVENLKGFWDKCGGNLTVEDGNISAGLKKLKAKVAFPFNRDALQDLERIVNGLQENVGTSLAVLGM
jgi:hypothetical protein